MKKIDGESKSSGINRKKSTKSSINSSASSQTRRISTVSDETKMYKFSNDELNKATIKSKNSQNNYFPKFSLSFLQNIYLFLHNLSKYTNVV